MSLEATVASLLSGSPVVTDIESLAIRICGSTSWQIATLDAKEGFRTCAACALRVMPEQGLPDVEQLAAVLEQCCNAAMSQGGYDLTALDWLRIARSARAWKGEQPA